MPFAERERCWFGDTTQIELTAQYTTTQTTRNLLGTVLQSQTYPSGSNSAYIYIPTQDAALFSEAFRQARKIQYWTWETRTRKFECAPYAFVALSSCGSMANRILQEQFRRFLSGLDPLGHPKKRAAAAGDGYTVATMRENWTPEHTVDGDFHQMEDAVLRFSARWPEKRALTATLYAREFDDLGLSTSLADSTILSDVRDVVTDMSGYSETDGQVRIDLYLCVEKAAACSKSGEHIVLILRQGEDLHVGQWKWKLDRNSSRLR